MATHSCNLAWKIPWTEKPHGLQSAGWQSQTQLSTHTHTCREVADRNHLKVLDFKT